ncbi:MAG: SDR family NAD(P)-dependent oxidoreductase [Allosphingosinicella sp.]
MTQPLHILVTGTSRGIGPAIVAALAGHRVVGHSSSGGDGRVAADLALPGVADGLWDEALARLDGRIDVLINNAGVFEAAPIDGSSGEWTAQWDRTMRVNLHASADLCRLAVLHFRARGGGGRIVNVASRAGYRGDSPDHWHYAASKGGMVAMTKSIARAYAAEGIYAFTICPGFTVTGMAEEYIASRGGSFLADIPLGRPADTEEVAEIARWLAVDAPASATGTVIDINGASFVR